mmetsp:Transcript_98693/g.282143  ORF Transcript_98693/g.282143 Transcript_98693/m.282143 type:complete len:200 (+) Transcript_98693:480-1079(+)
MPPIICCCCAAAICMLYICDGSIMPISCAMSSFLETLAPSRGTMSMRKSYVSFFDTAVTMSFRCSVRRLFSSVWFHASMESSSTKISHALANMMGASALIMKRWLVSCILISSSLFIIFLMRARGSSGCDQSCWSGSTMETSCMRVCQNDALRMACCCIACCCICSCCIGITGCCIDSSMFPAPSMVAVGPRRSPTVAV